MNQFSKWLFAILILLAIASGEARAQVTVADVDASIEKAIKSIFKLQNPVSGLWPDHGQYVGSGTSICVLALVNAGVPANDPRIQKALRKLADIKPSRVYTTAVQTMVFCAIDPEQYRLLIRRNVNWLEEGQVTKENYEGGWGYQNNQDGRPDNSNSQFALLALNEAQKADVIVDRRVWVRAQKYWMSRQLKSGGWRYGSQPNGTGSMTCAGITSLIVCERNLSNGDAYVVDNKVVCCGLQQNDNAIEKGIAWLARNFSVSTNPNYGSKTQKTWLYYYLYGLERVGRMSGRRLIGKHDWYREGAEFLVNNQTLVGDWVGTIGMQLGRVRNGQRAQRNHITTAMALLFLAKGKRPVLVSKLTHLPDEDWNRHRQDIGNLVRHVETRWNRAMTWQVIDHQRANAQDLATSPVVWLSGREGLKMSNKQKNSLRDYIEQGGFLFVEACCQGKKFDTDFRKLMAELFPDSELQPIPASHPIWYAEEKVEPQYMRPMFGINSCCRLSVVYCPKNLGCYWELARGKGQMYPTAMQKEIDAVLAQGANVIAYATNRELRDKLDTPPATTPATEQVDPILRGTLSVGKIAHGGGSDEAPAALANLLRTAGSQLKQRVNTKRLLLSPTDKSLPDYAVLFAHGRRRFNWDASERAAIGEFLTNGGVIFGDAICASQEFANAFKTQIKAILPEAEWKRIPLSHPMFTEEYKGFDISRLRIRRKQVGEGQRMRTQESSPQLEGVEVDGRFVVIFSPLDISCALESNASTECEGYVSEDAAKLGINILLYALQQ